jgi:hypothetical protein
MIASNIVVYTFLRVCMGVLHITWSCHKVHHGFPIGATIPCNKMHTKALYNTAAPSSTTPAPKVLRILRLQLQLLLSTGSRLGTR